MHWPDTNDFQNLMEISLSTDIHLW